MAILKKDAKSVAGSGPALSQEEQDARLSLPRPALPCPALPVLSARPPFRGRSQDTWTAEWTDDDDEQSENFLHFAPLLCPSLHDQQAGTAFVNEQRTRTR